MKQDADPPGGIRDAALARAEAWSGWIAMNARPALEREPESSQALGFALRVVDDALRTAGSGGARSVPSAGAIFPYDVLILCRRSGNRPAAIYRLDLDRQTCLRLSIDAERIDAMLRMPGQDSCDVRLILAARPWLSMRKYGARGYLFAHLDCGHAAANMLGAALDSADARLRLKLPRATLARELAAHMPCRDVHSVLDLWSPADARYDGGWEIALLPADWPADSTARLEEFCWASIPLELLCDDAPGGADASRKQLGDFNWLTNDFAVRKGEWTGLSRQRRSARKFEKHQIQALTIDRTLGTLTTRLPMDLASVASGEFTLTLVTGPRTAPGFGDGAPDKGVRVVRTAWADQPAGIIDAFFGQQHLGVADVFAVFHADRGRLFGQPTRQPLREALFRASAAAQLIYLGAARTGAAMTAIGGFDVGTWQAVAGTGPEEEILYIVALGSDGGGMYKLDRAEIAYAQGER
jgi:hypothetical protein